MEEVLKILKLIFKELHVYFLSICSLGGMSVGLVQIVMLPSRLCTALDVALEAWDGMKF